MIPHKDESLSSLVDIGVGVGSTSLIPAVLPKESTLWTRSRPQSTAASAGNGKKTLQIIQGDVLTVPLPFFDVLVATVPYNVSAEKYT